MAEKNTFSISKKFKTELITALLSSPIVYIPHYNYTYVDKAIREICTSGVLGFKDLKFVCETNDTDIIDFETKLKVNKGDNYSLITILNKYILPNSSSAIAASNSEKRDDWNIFLVKNIFNELANNNALQRLLQSYAAKYERGEYDPVTTIVMVSPEPMEQLPQSVEKLISVVEVPAPTDVEIENYLLENVKVSHQFETRKNDLFSQMTRTLQGLQYYEIEQIIQAVLVRSNGFLTEKAITYALEEKKSLVRKSGIIEVVDTDISFDQVGGLEILRDDLKRKATLFRQLNEVIKVKLPIPKGILVLGMPGCGKSLVAKSIANEFGVSLLRLDVNRLMGQYVGQSEANLRKALATAEAAHPCVLWIDEIEKAFAGANSGGGAGNDIVMRLMGHFLTWMQERKTAVYIVATANDAMRPEFMRKGRFDEVYFVDFPSLRERTDILKKKIDAYTMSGDQQRIFDMTEVSSGATIEEIAKLMVADDDKKSGFAGAEIQSVVEAVIEKKYIEYLTNNDSHKQKDKIPEKVKITKKDFEEEIKIVKPSVMANQKGKEENGVKHKTSVERIRELQEVYKFKKASK